MRYFPVFLDLDGKTVLVAGGGNAALNKLRLFGKTRARLRCVALEFNKEILELAASGRIEVLRAEPASMEFGDALVVVAATESEADEIIARRAQQSGLLVNAVDKTSLCSFITPSIAERGSVAVAIGTEGGAPVLARRLREQVEILLPENLGTLANFIAEHREHVSKTLPSISDRRSFWEGVVDGEIGRLALANRLAEARESLKMALAQKANALKVTISPRITIIVSPSAPDDLTIKALRALQDADAIILANDVPAPVIDRARRDAKRLPVGGAPVIGDAFLEIFADQAQAGHSRIVLLLSPETDLERALDLARLIGSKGYVADLCAIAVRQRNFE